MKATREIRFLKRIEKLDALIEYTKNEKLRWLDIATSITAPMGGERVQTSSNGKKMESAIVNSMDYDGRILELNRERDEIIRMLEELPLKEFDLLYKHYVLRMDYKTIANVYGKSYSWCTSVHGRALQSLKKILDRKVEK